MSQLKQRLYPALHPFTKSFRPLLRDKTDNIDELVAVYDDTDEVRDYLANSRFSRNTWFSSLKYVEIEGERYYESDSYVYFENGPFSYGQIHVWLIPVDDEVRVYSHREWPIFRPVKHQGSEREAGDVTGLVAEALP